MINDLMYIELKTGFNDDGPAWIGKIEASKTRKTIYFNGHSFRRFNCGYANYVDVETGDEYWISGLKKDGCNRHWSGHGKIFVDRNAASQLLDFLKLKTLNPNQYELVDIKDN